MDERRDQILALVAASEGSHKEAAMASTIALLTDENVEKIAAQLAIVSNLSPRGAAAYERVLESCQKSSAQVANAVTLAWRHSNDMTDVDRSSLRPGAKLYGVHLNNDREEMAQASPAVAGYLLRQRDKLLAESERLDKLRQSIQSHDVVAVTKVPVNNRVMPTNPLDTLLSTVPSNLSSFITKVGENELEMIFPLTNLTKRQKIGMSAGLAKYLQVRLLYGGRGIFPGYCVHLSDENRPKTAAHKPWLFSTHEEAPNDQYCFGRPNIASYQISRILWRHLDDGFVSLEDTWHRIASNVGDLAQRCPVCGTHQKGTRLLRSTVCGKNENCGLIFAARSFQWHLQEVWEDPNVYDLLLTMIQATALTGQPFLLHDCPISDAKTLETLIDRIPPIAEFGRHLAHALTKTGSETSLADTLKPYLPSQNPQARNLANLLTWLGSSYNGFLTTATGRLRIPSFHRTSQFLLANASPEREAQFAAHLTAAHGASCVLYHGTSMDRLHSILRQGLLVCSGTCLERNGANYGDGVYLTSDPGRASDYTMDFTDNPRAYASTLATGQPSANNTYISVYPPRHTRSPYQGLGVLLACEVVPFRDERLFDDLFVIKDPTRVMVRYVFLMERNQYALAGEVTPAIENVLLGLRRGEL